MEITLEEWDKTYKPINNHLDEHASFGGAMFETFGEELDFVRSHLDKFIWTYIDGEDDATYIVEGYHLVNRIGYFITEVPAPDGEFVSVVIDEPRKTLSSMTTEEIEQVACFDCNEYNIWEYACYTYFKDNEAICVFCCECPEHIEEKESGIILDSAPQNH
jgi:hypothetical protein